MENRYDAFVARLKTAVLDSPGKVASEARRAILNRDTRAIPPALTPYVLKVALHAYKITDEDVHGLRRDGFSEDEIFEVTASAAVGAALLRLEKGMAALRAADQEPRAEGREARTDR